MTDASFEEAKTYLQSESSGTSMFDHLSEVLLKVLTERPADPVQAFEQLSSIVKQDRVKVEDDQNREISPLTLEQLELAKKYYKDLKKLHLSVFEVKEEEALFQPPSGEADGGEGDIPGEEEEEEEEEIPVPRPEAVEDILAKFDHWQIAGTNPIGTKEDALLFMLSMGQLAGRDSNIETLRFWGKLLGREGDYYVVEGTKSDNDLSTDEDESDKGNNPEEEANKFTYWVCSAIGSPKWVELPVLTPNAVLRARQIRRFLTGNLDSPVCGFPVFPGTERHLVRALIALINSNCALAPSGYFTVEEDATEATLAEEYAPEGVEDISNWQVYGSAFNEMGRVAPLTSEDEDGNPVSEPDGWELEPLREVETDLWNIRKFPYSVNEGEGGSKVDHVVFRSKEWPGALVVGNNDTGMWTNVYVGYGTQYLPDAYTPPMPPKLQTDVDMEEFVEQEDVLEDPNPPEEDEE